MVWRKFLPLLVALAVSNSQSTGNFKTCAQSEICSFLRNKPPNPQEFGIRTNNVYPSDNTLRIPIVKNDINVLNLFLTFYQEEIIRLQIYESNDPNRYYLDSALDGEPAPDPTFNFIFQNDQQAHLIWGGSHYLIINDNPFSVELYNTRELIAVFNKEGRLTFDHEGNNRAIGFDMNFPNASHAYGLPLHADNLFLRQTTENGIDPYRLYNVNFENYEVNSTKALSGSIPVLYAHGSDITAGVFFHNGYETWVDVDYTQGGVSTHFMVEDGIFDAFFLLGPTPAEVYRQYTILTGVTPLPPGWALGYHHTALSFDNQETIIQMLEDFDDGGFPIESVFIQNRRDRDFLWDLQLFNDPIDFQSYLRENNRKVVAMMKPTISLQENYQLLDHVIQNDMVVFAPSRWPYAGPCDAGNCTFWDYVNPSALQHFIDQFRYINYDRTTNILAGFWNEENEPFVANAEERVLGRDNIHYAGFLHKDIHNTYGHNMNEATFLGTLHRDNNQRRPFVVAESFFAGSQRYTSVYTGKHEATWDHLRISFKMCLATSLTGLDFCGGNIGGYFGNVDDELLARWYQLGAWLPLFRSHYSDESDRREPYLLSTAAQANIRTAIRNRYTHLDYWYTTFYEHQRFRTSVLQPLFYKYPADIAVGHEESFFVGDNIYISPVTRPGIRTTTTYLTPGEIWYDVDNNLVYQGYGNTNVNVYPDRIPTFYRGGSIVTRRDNPQRNTAETFDTLYTVYIFLNSDNEAHGTLYMDDRWSFFYRDIRRYYYMRLDYVNGAISLGPIDTDVNYPDFSFNVDRYLLYRPSTTLKSGDDKNPERIEPEVFTHAPDGKPFSSFRLNMYGENVIELV